MLPALSDHLRKLVFGSSSASDNSDPSESKNTQPAQSEPKAPTMQTTPEPSAQTQPAPVEPEKEQKIVGDVWVRTDAGFGKLLDTQNEIAKVQLDWGVVHVRQSSLRKHIDMYIFTFFEDKEPFSINVSVGEPLRSIKKQIVDKFKVNSDEIRLLSQGNEISSLKDDLPLARCGLSSSGPWELMVIVDEICKFTLDPNARSGNVELSSDFLTATLSPNVLDTDCAVRGTTEIDSGKVYWDVKMVNCATGKCNLGVCTRGVNINSYIGCNESGWSYYGSTGKAEHGGDSQEYGETFTTGDVIRVKLDMDNHTLSFVKNGVDQGIAFRGLPSKLFPAFSMYTRNDCFSIIKFGTFE